MDGPTPIFPTDAPPPSGGPLGSSAQEGSPRKGLRGLLLRALRGRRLGDLVFVNLTRSAAVVVVGLVVGIVASLMISGKPAFEAIGSGFLGPEWLPGGQPPRYGALPLVWGTLVTAGLALLLGVPVAFGIAIVLSELAPPVVRTPLSIVIELLAAIPSVVYGLWGIFILAPFLRDSVYPGLQATWGWTGLFGGAASGYSVLTAAILLAIMIIPTVSAISREVLRAVPVAQREAALALGATPWEVVRMAVLPYGRSGLFGASVLGLARAIGETMAVTMVIGNRNAFFSSLLQPANTIPSVLANEVFEASGTHLSALFALGIILFLVALTINIFAQLLLLRLRRRGAHA